MGRCKIDAIAGHEGRRVFARKRKHSKLVQAAMTKRTPAEQQREGASGRSAAVLVHRQCAGAKLMSKYCNSGAGGRTGASGAAGEAAGDAEAGAVGARAGGRRQRVLDRAELVPFVVNAWHLAEGTARRGWCCCT